MAASREDSNNKKKNKIWNWIEERIEMQRISDDIGCKFVPSHVNLFYCLGGIVFTCFMIQISTGFFLTFYYIAEIKNSSESIARIMTEINAGFLIRGIHRWGSSFMIGSILMHVFRIFLTGGLSKPREMTWMVGILLGSLGLLSGLTGYSLPWDQIGYWACRIVTSMPESMNHLLSHYKIGNFLIEIVRGGTSVNKKFIRINC